jgi:hypothetical protein
MTRDSPNHAPATLYVVSLLPRSNGRTSVFDLRIHVFFLYFFSFFKFLFLLFV